MNQPKSLLGASLNNAFLNYSLLQQFDGSLTISLFSTHRKKKEDESSERLTEKKISP